MLKWVMLLTYIVLSAYVLYKLLHWLKSLKPQLGYNLIQAVCTGLFLIVASSPFWGAFLPRSQIQILIHKIGNLWIGFLIYLIFFNLLADIIIFIYKKVNKEKIVVISKNKIAIFLLGMMILSLSIGFTTYGVIHARDLNVTSYDITVNKEINDIKDLKIIFVADLHLGYNMGIKDIKKMVNEINKQTPDLVVYGGDIFDNDYDALDNPEQMIKYLKSIKSKYGSYAVYGNHDVKETLVGGFSISSSKNAIRDKRMEIFLERANINALLDQVQMIADDQIYLVGRLDGEKTGNGTSERMTIEQLTKSLDKSKPIIVINHEPNQLHESALSGVDVLLSGHSHAGQFFPLTIVQFLAWENYCGVKKIDDMYSIVTSGIGVYGPALRVGTDSEIMDINMHFDGYKK